MKFGMYIEVDEYCMSHDPIQGQGHGACEIPIIALFKVYLLHHLEGAGKWPLILKLEHNI